MPLDTESPILLVDDSPAVLALFRDILKAQGYVNVRTATSVDEGLRVFGEQRPRVVFLDLMMPESSGIEFTRQALASDPHVRIVLTTALPSTHESVVLAVAQGASDYLSKPLRRDHVAAFLRHFRPEDEVEEDEDEEPNHSTFYR